MSRACWESRSASSRGGCRSVRRARRRNGSYRFESLTPEVYQSAGKQSRLAPRVPVRSIPVTVTLAAGQSITVSFGDWAGLTPTATPTRTPTLTPGPVFLPLLLRNRRRPRADAHFHGYRNTNYDARSYGIDKYGLQKRRNNSAEICLQYVRAVQRSDYSPPLSWSEKPAGHRACDHDV